MHIIGVDPGTSGGLVVLTSYGQFIEHIDCPTFSVELPPTKRGGKPRRRTVTDLKAMAVLVAELKDKYGSAIVGIERVHPMPKEGVVSVWTFASAFHPWIALMHSAEFDVYLIPPQEWKKHFKLGNDKKASVKAVSAIVDNTVLIRKGCRVPDHNIAEAALLAEYTRLKFVVGLSAGRIKAGG